MASSAGVARADSRNPHRRTEEALFQRSTDGGVSVRLALVVRIAIGRPCAVLGFGMWRQCQRNDFGACFRRFRLRVPRAVKLGNSIDERCGDNQPGNSERCSAWGAFRLVDREVALAELVVIHNEVATTWQKFR